MNSGGTAIEELADRLISQEMAAGGASANACVAAARVSERLRRPICTIAGTIGFRSLLLRAVSLAKAEHPVLGPVQVAADGALTGLDMLADRSTDSAVRALIVQFLELLTNFIGEALTLRLLQDSWPELEPSHDRTSWNPNESAS